MSLAAFSWYVAATGGVLGFLWFVGLPFQLVLDDIAGKPGRAVPAALFSLFAITIGSWYVLGAGHVVSRLPILLAASAALIIAAIVVVRILLRPPPFDRHHVEAGLSQLWTAAMVFALNMVVSVFTFGALYARGGHTALSLGNNDIAAYASEAQHLLEGGFQHPGPVVGTDMAHSGKALGYGADAVLANVAALLRTDVFHVLHLTMLVATFLGVYGLVRLLNERLGVSRAHAVLSAQAAYGVFFVAYLGGQYFLSQLLAMALLPGFLILMIDVARSDSWRTWVSGLLGMAALAAAGIALYPQLTLVTAVMFLPAVAVGGPLSGLMRRALMTAGALAGGIALGAAVDPSLSRIGWHTSLDLTSVSAGWPLPRLFLTDMLGFQTTTSLHHSTVAWLVSGAIILALVASTGWLIARHALSELTVFVSVAVVLVLGSYLVVFWLEGVSYRQWKWITYLLPLLVSLTVALFLSAVSLIETRFMNGVSIALAAGSGYLLAVIALASPASFPVTTQASYGTPVALPAGAALFVSPDTIALAKSAEIRGLQKINVDVLPYWDTMWVAYFLRQKQLYLESPSYYPAQKSGADWTIERNDMPATTSDVVRLNATYRVAHHPPS